MSCVFLTEKLNYAVRRILQICEHLFDNYFLYSSYVFIVITHFGLSFLRFTPPTSPSILLIGLSALILLLKCLSARFSLTILTLGPRVLLLSCPMLLFDSNCRRPSRLRRPRGLSVSYSSLFSFRCPSNLNKALEEGSGHLPVLHRHVGDRELFESFSRNGLKSSIPIGFDVFSNLFRDVLDQPKHFTPCFRIFTESFCVTSCNCSEVDFLLSTGWKDDDLDTLETVHEVGDW